MKIVFCALLTLSTLTVTGQKTDKAAAHFQKANEAVDRGEYDKAIPSYLKAIKADETGSCGSSVKGKAHGDLGYAYFRSGDTTNAMVYFDRAIRLNNQNPFPRAIKADILLMQNKQKAALKELDDLIRHNPTFIDGYVQRGYIHHAEKQYDQAEIDLKKALSLDSVQHILPPPRTKTILHKLSEMEAGKQR
jgi:tetratricopeptide (TPR) repeat protein